MLYKIVSVVGIVVIWHWALQNTGSFNNMGDSCHFPHSLPLAWSLNVCSSEDARWVVLKPFIIFIGTLFSILYICAFWRRNCLKIVWRNCLKIVCAVYQLDSSHCWKLDMGLSGKGESSHFATGNLNCTYFTYPICIYKFHIFDMLFTYVTYVVYLMYVTFHMYNM